MLVSASVDVRQAVVAQDRIEALVTNGKRELVKEESVNLGS